VKYFVFPLVVVGLLLAPVPCKGEEKTLDALDYARGAGLWILSLAKSEAGRLTWPVNDTGRKESAFDLYSGMPGGILLLAELGREDPAGPFQKAVPACVAGLESLRIADAWGIRNEGKVVVPSGLYSGIAGIGWLYMELYRITGEKACREKAQSIVSQLLVRQASVEGGSLWDDGKDIISGAAGTGLFLLRAAEELNAPRCLDLATRAGSYLVSQGIPTPTGLTWKSDESDPKLYPNFSRGTAGIAYFLLRLFEATKEDVFFTAALGGAANLESLAVTSGKGNSCAWYHHELDGEDLWYVGWGHGPAGTARLFYELSKVNRLPRWARWVNCSANWLIGTGIPNPPKPINGYWNEGICCGTAGVGDFFVDLYRVTGKREYLQVAERLASHLVAVASTSGQGYRWVQAENRAAPDKKDAQTGYAQGAAGIGLFFLKLSRAQRGVETGWRLPDNPF
jgi:lantibiotic modifying enzyme